MSFYERSIGVSDGPERRLEGAQLCRELGVDPDVVWRVDIYDDHIEFKTYEHEEGYWGYPSGPVKADPATGTAMVGEDIVKWR